MGSVVSEIWQEKETLGGQFCLTGLWHMTRTPRLFTPPRVYYHVDGNRRMALNCSDLQIRQVVAGKLHLMTLQECALLL